MFSLLHVLTQKRRKLEEKEFYLLITRYLSNQTNTEENEKLADWIAADIKNDQTFEEIKRIWLARKHSADIESFHALAKLHAKMVPTTQKSSPTKASRLKYSFIAAAVAVIVFASGWFTYSALRSSAKSIGLSETTLAGQKKQIVLEDGTRVMLGPESCFTYPKSFDQDKRVVSLIGEAFFEVSKDHHKPFIVQTSSLDIQVLGTHFNVNASKGQVMSTVSLLEGKVKVTIKEDADEEYLLRPGQELSVNRISHQVFQHPLDSAMAMGWLNNILIIKNEQLGAVASRIEKMYGIKIIFADQATADTRLYARFNNQPVSEVMRVICASGAMTYHQEGHKIYIKLNADTKQK